MIKPITDQQLWNRFILACQPNTFLQSWEWGQVQKSTGEDLKHLGYYDNSGTLLGVALVVLVNARRGRHYLIPHGPIFASLTDHQTSAPILEKHTFTKQLIAELVSYLCSTAQVDKVCALRIAPLLLNTPDHQGLFNALGFRLAPLHVHAELTWVLDISQSTDQLLSNMRKTTRHAIRRAGNAGVTCEIVTDYETVLSRFWPLYEATRQRHGFVLWPRSMIKAQLKIFSENNKIFSIIARYENKDVAAAILPHFGSTVFYYHGASTKLPASVPATQLLQWDAIREAKRRGATTYNFWGIAPKNQPDHPFAGITTFKTGFGGYPIDYLHAQDLPFTFSYWKLWAIDSYRKLRRGF